ncbi:MAG: MarR family transcriptional regulator [Pseudomonadota bacterium]
MSKAILALAGRRDLPPGDDLIDQIIAQWGAVAPELDTEAMQVIGRVMRIGEALSAQAADAVAPFGLSYSEFDILVTMRRAGPPYRRTPSQIGNAVLLTSGAITAALDRLTDRGLLSRVSDPSDRRVRAAQLTDKGVELSYQAAKARFEAARRSLATFEPAEQRRLTVSLKALTRALRDAPHDDDE